MSKVKAPLVVYRHIFFAPRLILSVLNVVAHRFQFKIYQFPISQYYGQRLERSEYWKLSTSHTLWSINPRLIERRKKTLWKFYCFGDFLLSNGACISRYINIWKNFVFIISLLGHLFCIFCVRTLSSNGCCWHNWIHSSRKYVFFFASIQLP